MSPFASAVTGFTDSTFCVEDHFNRGPEDPASGWTSDPADGEIIDNELFITWVSGDLAGLQRFVWEIPVVPFPVDPNEGSFTITGYGEADIGFMVTFNDGIAGRVMWSSTTGLLTIRITDGVNTLTVDSDDSIAITVPGLVRMDWDATSFGVNQFSDFGAFHVLWAAAGITPPTEALEFAFLVESDTHGQGFAVDDLVICGGGGEGTASPVLGTAWA